MERDPMTEIANQAKKTLAPNRATKIMEQGIASSEAVLLAVSREFGTESEIIPQIATCRRKLLKSRRMPAGERPLTAAECYRFVLSHPDVDVCMTALRPENGCRITSRFWRQALSTTRRRPA